MKARAAIILYFLMCTLFTSRVMAAVTQTVWADAQTRDYVLIENNTDDNFFVTPGGVLDPRMTGASRWTSLKYTGSGIVYQESLGYIDNGYNTLLNGTWKFDMWVENSPAAHPLLGLRCINWYTGCDMATSLIQPEATDTQGFYGVTVPSGDAKWMHGMMADTFYSYLSSAPINSNFTMTLNTCQTSENYDARAGERCKNMNSGRWYIRKISHNKAAHLKFINTGAMSEIFIDSNGTPSLGEGNANCKLQTVNSLTGLSCKMVNYTLTHNGLDNTSIRIFPALNHAGLASAINTEDMQYSLDGQIWKVVNGTQTYYTFNDLKGDDSIYLFLSSHFFKKMIDLGLSDNNSRDLFNFRFRNIVATESGWYEFSTSNQLIIKPLDFSISIISTDYSSSPSLTGDVGSGKPALDFDYIVTTSGKTAADDVLISASGPSQTFQGRPWCIFSSSDGLTNVPFPASLSFVTAAGTRKTYDAGCDGQWRDMTDALWITTPWSDSNGDAGVMNKSTVRYSIIMNNPRSMHTLNMTDWYGEVSASGEIRVKATWKNVP